ncbi:hypothetical protein Fuma_02625 [Fuerstiella marisgermanici]|uniref:Uncharacterized protein n=1 Tax=Fuerstiella marisgermanici TaxID=1891926 RepID=A0A1P8WG36_9PLAN|nr:hypothetical protein Fuma_02625 [Fuerstiella marisgermanici]
MYRCGPNFGCQETRFHAATCFSPAHTHLRNQTVAMDEELEAVFWNFQQRNHGETEFVQAVNSDSGLSVSCWAMPTWKRHRCRPKLRWRSPQKSIARWTRYNQRSHPLHFRRCWRPDSTSQRSCDRVLGNSSSASNPEDSHALPQPHRAARVPSRRWNLLHDHLRSNTPRHNPPSAN